MRKGLVAALGVVVLSLAVSQGFALAPVISAIPDIIVSDAEQNGLTQDRNFFVFSDALDLDEYVRDDDTTKSLLKWCFVESSPGNSIAMNGIGSYTGTNYRDPGASNIRAVSPLASVRNILWSPPPGTSFPDPGVASAQAMVQMVVSDGTKVDSQPITITSVNTTSSLSTNRDRLVPHAVQTYTFTTGDEGWTWFEVTGGGIVPPSAHGATGGALTITEQAAQNPVVYGAWESPKNPSVALHSRWGAVLRARFNVTGPTGAVCPGFRMRAIWTKVTQSGGQWVVDFLNQDYNDDMEVMVITMDSPPAPAGYGHVAGREPGAGKTYALLFYPQQIDSLMSTDGIVYITFDMVDIDSFGNDAGTLSVNDVTVDALDRPASNKGTTVTAFTYSSFSTGWSRVVQGIGTGYSSAGLSIVTGASDIAITVAAGNQMFEASAVGPYSPMSSGLYYRTIFTLTSTQASGNFGPFMRAGWVSQQVAWTANKHLKSGGTWSAVGSTPTEFEMWVEAPSPLPPSTSQTEPMAIRFESYLTQNPVLPFNRTCAGTLRCQKIVTHTFPAP